MSKIVSAFAGSALLATRRWRKPLLTHGIPNFDCVDAERSIYRGGQPEDDEGWNFLKSIGVANVLKLNLEGEGTDIPATALQMNLSYYPISTWQQLFGPINRVWMDSAIGTIRQATFIHCEHGQDRTGLAVAIYRLRTGWLKIQAWNEMIAHHFHPILHGLTEAFEDYPQPPVQES